MANTQQQALGVAVARRGQRWMSDGRGGAYLGLSRPTASVTHGSRAQFYVRLPADNQSPGDRWDIVFRTTDPDAALHYAETHTTR